MQNSDKLKFFSLGSLVGLTVGLLAAPKKGCDLRSDINKGFENAFKSVKKISNNYVFSAKKLGHDIVVRSENIYKIVKDFSEGRYKGSLEAFNSEISKLKAGLNAAIETYKTYGLGDTNPDEVIEEVFTEYQSEIMNDESLPKFEGMHKRAE